MHQGVSQVQQAHHSAQSVLQLNSIQPQLLPHLLPCLAGLQGQLEAHGAALHPLAAAWQSLETARHLPGWVCMSVCDVLSLVGTARDADHC